jgi:hypothetical protein
MKRYGWVYSVFWWMKWSEPEEPGITNTKYPSDTTSRPPNTLKM